MNNIAITSTYKNPNISRIKNRMSELENVFKEIGNSMSNHPDHNTHTSQIFFKLSPVVGIIKSRQS